MVSRTRFGGDVGANGVLEGGDFVQCPEGVLAHLLAGEEFGEIGGKVQVKRQG
jgi:hypothetical protein